MPLISGLAYLPAAHAEQEAHHIALLLLLKLLEVLVGAHLGEVLVVMCSFYGGMLDGMESIAV